jgi:hypothetical protein
VLLIDETNGSIVIHFFCLICAPICAELRCSRRQRFAPTDFLPFRRFIVLLLDMRVISAIEERMAEICNPLHR